MVPTAIGVASARRILRPLSKKTFPYAKEIPVANISDSLNKIMELSGCVACAIVDYNNGTVLGKKGSGVNLEIAGAGNSEVVKAKLRVMKQLGIPGVIEDILITLSNQYHIIRPLTSRAGLFMYIILEKDKANLGMSRYKSSLIEADLIV